MHLIRKIYETLHLCEEISKLKYSLVCYALLTSFRTFNGSVMRRLYMHMFLSTPRFKFLDVTNYLTLGLSNYGWCKVNGCSMEELILLYKWLDDYSKLTYLGLVVYEAFYSILKGGPTIMHDEYDRFV